MNCEKILIARKHPQTGFPATKICLTTHVQDKRHGSDTINKFWLKLKLFA